jgi:hypothetical protein
LSDSLKYTFKIPTNQKQIDELKASLIALEEYVKSLEGNISNANNVTKIEVIKDTQDSVSNLKKIIETTSSNFEDTLSSEIGKLNKLINNIFNTLVGQDKALESLLRIFEGNLKQLDDKVNRIVLPTVSSGSENVKVTKVANNYKISVDIPEVTKEVIKEVTKTSGGGISQKKVTELINSAIEEIPPSPSQELDAILTYTAGGDLDTYTTSGGSKTFVYSLDGTLTNIIGTGIYSRIEFTYDSESNLIGKNYV